jgi:hypothetical protein
MNNRVEGMAITSAKVTPPEDLGCIYCTMVTNSTNLYRKNACIKKGWVVLSVAAGSTKHGW